MSQLGEQVQTSLASLAEAEEKIQTRSAFKRFFVGGDSEAVEKIKQLVESNQNRITEMKQILTACGADCDGEVKTELQTQLELVEQEQNRIDAVAQQEQEKKGMFGWMFGWL